MTSAAASFEALPRPAEGSGGANFAVHAISAFPGRFVAKSSRGFPAFLLEVSEADVARAPIVLRHVHLMFGVRCSIAVGDATRRVRTTVILCRSDDADAQDYFLRVGDAVLTRELEDSTSIAVALETIATLFEKLGKAKTRQAQGLFGELLLIASASDVPGMIEGWRSDPTEHFDFSWEEARLEVKTSSIRSRRHEFSMAQCSSAGPAILASIFVERLTGGTSILDLSDRIAASLDGRTDLILKVELLIASALGVEAVREIGLGFDEAFALESLILLDIQDIPAIRGHLPEGVSNVRFVADVGNTRLASDELVGILPYQVGSPAGA